MLSDYPKVPPLVHYISYVTDRLNPNLYEEGKVCVSLLGTWSGKGTETWSPNSNMLQLLVSIQGLILVSEVRIIDRLLIPKKIGGPQILISRTQTIYSS